MHEIIAFSAILSIFIVSMVFLALKRWLYSWEGILKNKIVKDEEGVVINDSDFAPGRTRRYILVFKTSKGKIIKRTVGEGRFKSAMIGTRYVKLRKSWSFKRRDQK